MWVAGDVLHLAEEAKAYWPAEAEAGQKMVVEPFEGASATARRRHSTLMSEEVGSSEPIGQGRGERRRKKRDEQNDEDKSGQK